MKIKPPHVSCARGSAAPGVVIGRPRPLPPPHCRPSRPCRLPRPCGTTHPPCKQWLAAVLGCAVSPGASLAVGPLCVVLSPWRSSSLWPPWSCSPSCLSRCRCSRPCRRTRVLRRRCGVLGCSSSVSGTGAGVRRRCRVVALVVWVLGRA